ncbi:unnamed protein product [Onchocerca flexuosa]|uniref:Uncharacterized protein n=1 Tax=Onchocerca flexuosa TaxID=387005 RepID=A0A183HGQ1_9BILA|nr:unnamed protein product [Onchocerca flexuosa]
MSRCHHFSPGWSQYQHFSLPKLSPHEDFQ